MRIKIAAFVLALGLTPIPVTADEPSFFFEGGVYSFRALSCTTPEKAIEVGLSFAMHPHVGLGKLMALSNTQDEEGRPFCLVEFGQFLVVKVVATTPEIIWDEGSIAPGQIVLAHKVTNSREVKEVYLLVRQPVLERFNGVRA